MDECMKQHKHNTSKESTRFGLVSGPSGLAIAWRIVKWYKTKHGARLYISFLLLWPNTRDKQKKERFGLQFLRFQSMVIWLCCFEPVMRVNTVGEHMVEQSFSRHGPAKQKEEGRGSESQHTLCRDSPNDFTPTGLHLLKALPFPRSVTRWGPRLLARKTLEDTTDPNHKRWDWKGTFL